MSNDRANGLSQIDLDSILNALEDGVYITNASGLTLKINRAYENMTGITANDVVGKYMTDIVKKGYLSTTITQGVIDSGKEVSAQQTTRNGTHVALRGIPIFENGGIKLVVTFVRDNTVIERIQSELNKSKILIDQYKKRLNEVDGKKTYVATSKGFRDVISLAHKVADVDSTVLILGESGTGKEIIAREIHSQSYRAKNTFLKINCGAIPENLLEAELFGYDPGAFTGAKKHGHIGVFEMCHNGTVFLDEIGDMPLVLQVKLLRVLQEKTITRIGSNQPLNIDTRVIAATNQDLVQMVKERKFREDLYYRLNVIVISSPPLRERKEDIPVLIDFFTQKNNKKYGLSKNISTEVVKEMVGYDWPGNVRELENTVERLVVTAENNEIALKDADFSWLSDSKLNIASIEASANMSLQDSLDALEEKIILDASRKYKTTYEVAQALGISQPSAYRKLRKHIKTSQNLR